MRSLPQTVVAAATDQEDLQRAGYILVELVSGTRPADRRERSYTFHGASGSSAVLVDTEYPTPADNRRELVFNITFEANDGRTPGKTGQMDGISPKLVAAMRRAVSQDPALIAGLGYLATAGDPGMSPDALQSAVIDYLQRYQQPLTAMLEDCAGCGTQDGVGDEYIGGPDMSSPLNAGGPGWRIAGLRHFQNGNSTFRLEITATIRGSSS